MRHITDYDADHLDFLHHQEQEGPAICRKCAEPITDVQHDDNDGLCEGCITEDAIGKCPCGYPIDNCKMGISTDCPYSE